MISFSPAAWHKALERHLESAGFSLRAVRHILCTQIIFSVFALLAGAGASVFTPVPIAFGAGAALSTFSLWHVARLGERCANMRFSAGLGLGLFFGFSLRLLLIGAVLVLLLGPLKLPALPILAGLTSTVAGIAVWGATRLFGKTTTEE
ncbi:MAG: hypothetical protein LBS65_11175 [Desulfovibrio sp.]|jgi:hypothetical protein|nr:hypothetical protein [Desulfovibrio sp.]